MCFIGILLLNLIQIKIKQDKIGLPRNGKVKFILIVFRESWGESIILSPGGSISHRCVFKERYFYITKDILLGC